VTKILSPQDTEIVAEVDTAKDAVFEDGTYSSKRSVLPSAIAV